MAPESTQARSDTGKRITGGQLVARALKTEGIKAIFTLSGGHVMDIYNGCAHEGIAIIGCRHEQAAAQ